ncbi:MAG: efflux RND transporter permease subunit [Cyanobacteria bacterium SZAS-4]|nr:efflux RND transporter permease subunit [Cyanobacteria bacterium SZAS-4]
MNFSRIFIVRPVMTTLLMVALLIFGTFAYFSLAVNDLPAVDFPTISVSASLPGANAETMASAVATPLEKQFGSIAGLDNMSSTNSMGSTQISLQFNLTREIDGAAEDVQAAIIAARPLLPTSMPTPPTFKKVNPADAPILFIALSSPTLPLYTVDEYAENVLAPRISMTSGVAQVQVFGSQIFSPHVQVDPRKLASYGIGIDEVANAIRTNNVNLPTGTLSGPKQAPNIRVNGQLFNAKAFAPLIVTYKNGAPVRLSDLGNVIDSTQTDKVATWYKDTRAVVLAVQRQPGTNTIQIVDHIRELLPNFRAILPKAVDVNILFDRSQGIRRSVDDVQRTLLITIGLVILVIFFFLGNVPTTIIASLSLPVSILGTFAAMKMFGFTLNNISLMALTLCVGFVVDDAIVVMENIVRHIEMGETPMEAALNGSREIGFTVVSMTVSLIAVFIPVLLMGGIIGRLFFEFGVTMSVAILISGFVALTLTPMLCSRFISPQKEQKKNLMIVISDRIFGVLLYMYEQSLRVALEHKLIVTALFVVMVAATVQLISIMPKGFLPTEDQGQIMGTTEAIQGISFTEMVRHQQEIAAIVQKEKAVSAFMSSVGASGPTPSANQGRIMMVMKPFSERTMSVDDIIQDLRKKTSRIPGIKFFMQNTPAIRIGGMQTKAMYQLTLSSSNTDELYKTANALLDKLRDLPQLQDVNTDLQVKNLQLNIKIDRDKMSKLGLGMDQVQDALNSAYSQRQVSVIYTPTNQYWVILEVSPEFNQDASMLEWLKVRTAAGDLVPISTVATVSRGVGPMQVNHLGQFTAVTLSFNLKPQVSLSEAVDKVKDIAKSMVPEDVTYKFQGNAQIFESSVGNLGLLLIVSILVIYIVLGILYESFVHPFTILSGLPSAGLGAVLILLAFHMVLDIYGFLGLVLLIGIVKKNAIMMVDFAVDYERTENVSAEDAIFKACITRFRPIVMTTMCALLGSLPIAIALGQGSEARRPLGLTIVGGLLVSQLVTLYITPVFYIYLDRLQKRLAERKHRVKPATAHEGI